MKKFLCLLLCLFLTACSSTPSASAPSEGWKDKYTDLAKDTVIEAVEKDKLEAMISHGTCVLFLGFPECPWCQYYLPVLDEVLKENDLNGFYYNIYVHKNEDAAFYDKIAALIDEVNDSGEEPLHYNNEGRLVVWMPLTLFIDNGRIVKWDGESNDLDSSVIAVEDYWTEEKDAALRSRLAEGAALEKKAQAANGGGCDTGCKVN